MVMRTSPGLNILWMVVLLQLSGCASFKYYIQSVRGHFDLIGKRQSIESVLANPDTDATTRAHLQLVQRLRRFASDSLWLPNDRSYKSYADIERDFVVWNVFATPELSLQPISWCFLVVGCLDYRGYFSRSDAERFARELRSQGNDVHVGGVTAYSTLGWFDDPVLNTMLRWGESRLALVLLHELAHQRVYVADDTAFNEAFATAVAREGLRRWLAGSRDQAQAKEARFEQTRSDSFIRLAEETREALRLLFESNLSDGEKRTGKAQAFSVLRANYREFKSAWNGYEGYDEWMQELNNAKLQSIATYYDDVAGFEGLLRLTDGDLRTFYDAANAISKLGIDTRHACLDALAGIAGKPGSRPMRSPTACETAISSAEM